MLDLTRREQIGALVLAGLLVTGLLLRFVLLPRPAEVLQIENAAQAENEETERKEEYEQKVTTIIVHVAGEVNRPGVYVLPEGARVHDALQAAGGAGELGDPHALNLAEPLQDGRRVYVPKVGEEINEAAQPDDGRININTASAGELEELPGIGPAKAAAIVSYREKNGPFRTAEDLVNVPGIGPKTLENMRESITLR